MVQSSIPRIIPAGGEGPLGKEIVYCKGCGTNLREEDFAKGRAHLEDNQPFCSECRPKAKPAPAAKSKSAPVPVVKPPSTRKSAGHGTGRVPLAQQQDGRRRPAPAPKSGLPMLPLIIGGVVLFLALLIIVAIAFSRREKSRPTLNPTGHTIFETGFPARPQV